jgi:hypothetical protein
LFIGKVFEPLCTNTTKMKSFIALGIMLVCSLSSPLTAKSGFEKVSTVHGVRVTLHINENNVLAYLDSTGTKRYFVQNLPKALLIDGLVLLIDGDIGSIPPNVRMMGTPFRMTCATLSKTNQKKFKLAKRRYCA